MFLKNFLATEIHFVYKLYPVVLIIKIRNREYSLKTNPGENQPTSVLGNFFFAFRLFTGNSKIRMYKFPSLS